MEDMGKTGKWDWTEPTNEDYKNNLHKKACFRIYRIEDGKEINEYKFWSEGEDSAYEVLVDYVKDHQDGKEHFYSTSGYYVYPDGTRHDTFLDDCDSKDWFFTRVSDFLFYRVGDVYRFVVRRVSNTIRYLFTGHAGNEWWSIDKHVLADLRHNLPILIAKHVGYPSSFDKKARELLDSDKAVKREYGDSTDKLATKMWEEEVGRLLENVLLYEYYDSFGVFDDGDSQMAEIDRKYRDTLVYKRGMNKEFDFRAMYELAQKKWDSIWDWMKEYGQNLWD